jgi:6-phosphogluconolactonase
MIDLNKIPSAAAHEVLLAALQRIIQRNTGTQPIHIALSGGNTPAPFYRAISECETIPWPRIHWWIGDERTVPSHDPQSNEKMIRQTLGAVRSDLHLQTWHLHTDPQKAAEAMDKILRKTLGAPPVFDLILLGIGTDGHTASLFPETAALDETHAYAVLNEVPQLQTKRWTFTYPVLAAAKEIWFLAQGENKAEMIHRLLARDTGIPSARIQNRNQKVYWIL